MIRLLLSIIIFTIALTGYTQKKKWILKDGTLCKKSKATCYYTINKPPGSNYLLIKKYDIGEDYLYEQIGFKNKKLLIKEGPYISFYNDSSIRDEGKFINNLRVGTWTLHSLNGDYSTGDYTKGLKSGEWSFYNKHNRIISRLNYSDGVKQGDSVVFYPNGNLIHKRFSYQSDTLIKLSNFYFSGELEFEGDYNDHKRVGLWNYYYKNGALFWQGEYKKGKKNGLFEEYYKSGYVEKKTFYKNNNILSSKYFYEKDKEDSERNSPNATGAVYFIVENTAEFPGGFQKMFDFLLEHKVYPKRALEQKIEGRAYIMFTVDKDGSIKDIKAAPLSPGKAIHSLLVAEAIRVVSIMPNWTPATQMGKPVRSKYTIPVNFKIK